MIPGRVTRICVCVVFTCAARTSAQQSAAASPQASPPANRIVERTYPSSVVAPSRVVQTGTASDRGQTIVEVMETPGHDGRMQPYQETRTETVRTGTDTVVSRQKVFGYGPQRQPLLLQSSESEETISANGNAKSVQTTWVADPDGRLGLASRQIEETRSTGPDGTESVTTILRPDVNHSLQQTERTDFSEQRVGPSLVRHDSSRSIRDLNGRWQAAETRTHDVRQLGPADTIEEEVVRSPDAGGAMTVSEKTVTHRTVSNGREDLLIESFGQSWSGFVRTGARPELTQRIRVTTTAASDGGRETIEEVEARSLVASGDPMRVVRRSVVTVRRNGPDRWLTERRVFELDANGRMSPVMTEKEETVER